MSDDGPDIPDEHRADGWGESTSPQEVIDDMQRALKLFSDHIDQVTTTARTKTPPDRYRSPARMNRQMMLACFTKMARDAVEEGMVDPGEQCWVVAQFTHENRELVAEGTVYAEKPFNVDPRAEIAKVIAPLLPDEDSPHHDPDRDPDD